MNFEIVLVLMLTFMSVILLSNPLIKSFSSATMRNIENSALGFAPVGVVKVESAVETDCYGKQPLKQFKITAAVVKKLTIITNAHDPRTF